MDDKGKNASSFQADQEILDARGINMTVLEVAGLATCKYSERVQSMHLSADDLAFLKGLRRRIKNRLASQNSRRRSMEHLRRLSRELRAVRACKGDAATERASLGARRRELLDKARRLREHVIQVLKDRADPTPVPDIDIDIPILEKTNESHAQPKPTEKITSFVKPIKRENTNIFKEDKIEIEKSIKVEAPEEPKKINAKTVFLNSHFDANPQAPLNGVKEFCNGVIGNNDGVRESNNGLKEPYNSVMESYNGVIGNYNGVIEGFSEIGGVLNLSVKRDGRRSHGRKQSVPRRVTYVLCDNYDYEDAVLDLKIKKEPH